MIESLSLQAPAHHAAGSHDRALECLDRALSHAELTTWAMEEEILVSTIDGAWGKQEVEHSASMIRRLHMDYPDVQIRFTRDEEHL